MNKTSAKRRSKSACSGPRKRIRIDETVPISRKFSVGDLSNNSVNPIVKRRKELLEAIHLRKSFKYVCKKHSVTYLVENVRQEKKDNSKERRNEVLEGFRNLNLATVSPTSSQNSNSDPDVGVQESSGNNQIVMDSAMASCEGIPMNSISSAAAKASNDGGIFFDAAAVSGLLTKGLDSNIGNDKTSSIKDPNNNNFTAIPFSKCQAINPGYMTDESDESDESDDSEELDESDELDKEHNICKQGEISNDEMPRKKAHFCASHFMKNLNVRKLRGNVDLPRTENDDCMDSGLDEESNTCDCDYHERLRQHFFRREYESLSDDEMGNPF
ncbi:hypothetical protein QAD02_001835 [Eretmocerus hayati]|uniref:Uncharacterized protein n=1 Tax=Eretmocerus hayati TaxID=131215 RepID=A0ACC2NI34_9HYME|nr:hypothetical protein QAD02_001835 [Eretmocerus hayati]